MSPKLRAALHRAIDLVCDAMEEEAPNVPPKRKRVRHLTIAPGPAREIDEATRRRFELQVAKNRT